MDNAILNIYKKHINLLIADFEDKYNVNAGGSGMVAIQTLKFFENFGFTNMVIKANFKVDDNTSYMNFYKADHYSVEMNGNPNFVINKPDFEPATYRTSSLRIIDIDKVYYQDNGSYNHIHDIEFFKKLYEL